MLLLNGLNMSVMTHHLEFRGLFNRFYLDVRSQHARIIPDLGARLSALRRRKGIIKFLGSFETQKIILKVLPLFSLYLLASDES